MNDSLIVDTLYTALPAQTDSLVSKLADAQEQIRLLYEAHAVAQNQYYLLCGVVTVVLLLVFFLLRRRLAVVEQQLNDEIRCKAETLITRIDFLEKSLAEQALLKCATNKPHALETVPVAHRPVSESQPIETSFASEPVHTSQSIVSVHSLWVKYGSIQAPDSEGVLRISDRSLSDVSSASKWFVISYQDGSSTATYTINPDAMGDILQDLQTFRLFTAPFTLTYSVLPMHISVTHEGILQRVERGWIVKKRLVVKF